MATAYVKSGAGAALFAQSTAYVSGDKIVPKRSDTGTNHLIGKRYVWECTTAGTSAAAEPTWPASVTQDVTTVTSDTAVFTARRPGFSSGSTADWSFATIYLDYPGALMAAGDTVYVSDGHAESQGVAAVAGGTNTAAFITGVNYICVDDAAAPPTTPATTAVVETTGATNITMTTAAINAYFYGITWKCGSGAVTATLNTRGVFENCNFWLVATGSVYLEAQHSTWINCGYKPTLAAHYIAATSGHLRWYGGSLVSGLTSPTYLFLGANIDAQDLDLSNGAAGMHITTGGASRSIVLRRCKMPASWSGSPASGNSESAQSVEMHLCDDGATNYEYRRKDLGGEVSSDTTFYRTGGGSDGTNRVTYKMVARALAQYPGIVLRGPEMVVRNDTTGASVTATVEILHDSATALQNDEVWLDIDYLSAAGTPLGARVTTRCALLAAPIDTTASAAVWSYPGMTNPNARKLAATFTPQMPGFIHAAVRLALASATVYVDPVVTLS